MMGDREAEHTVPQTELQEIVSKISDLNKWRNVFSFHSLETSNSTHQVTACLKVNIFHLSSGFCNGSTGNGAPGVRKPSGLHPLVPLPRSAIPEPLLIAPDTGGQPISLEMAMELRKLLFGNVSQLFSCEWAKACFRFHEPYSDLAYALEIEKGGTRTILMAVQAYIIKYLLFIRTTEYTHLERLCRVSQQEQGEALAAALADTLWAAGGSGRAVICLVTAAIYVVPSSDYKADNFTERIHLFEFSEKAAAQEFILGHINCFKDERSHGVILFLYSLLFSRTLERYISFFTHFPLIYNHHHHSQLHLNRKITSSFKQGKILTFSRSRTKGDPGSACRGVNLTLDLDFKRKSSEAQELQLNIELLCQDSTAVPTAQRNNRACGTSSFFLLIRQRGTALISGTDPGATVTLCVWSYRVQEDLDCTATPLLNCSFGNITCTQATLSLLLTGRASPHELDGSQELGPRGDGIKAWRQRGPVGYLRWSRAQVEQQVCHSLRTPCLPIWLCSINGRHSVLFGTDSQILSDWKRERVFHLYFYSGQLEQTKTAHLTIDTHSHHWEEDQSEDPSSPGKRRLSVEMAIRTKWAGATVSWNGTDPFF
ncbi:inactive ubiquitin carboxyl-terminal hydrolase MINDY-4B [Guaruba guarouba]